jgi:hypothetical protein
MPEGLTLPVTRRNVFDNSIIETMARCPRRGFYSYWLNRAVTKKSHPLSWGSAVHKFMEVLEGRYLTDGQDLTQASTYRSEAIKAGATYWSEDPPLGHKRDWMTMERLIKTFDACFEFWLREKNMGQRQVLHTEQAFTITLPNGREFGGRIDQLLEWNGRLWIRDFKTTSRMGATYGSQFDLSHQFSGYTYAARELSGRKVDGVIVNTIYNTKLKGPEVHEHLVTRKDAELEQWLESIQFEMSLIDQYEAQDIWPMRTVACNDYGGCPYQDGCKKGYWSHIDHWLKENTIESIWDFLNPDDEEGDVG